MKKEGVPKSNAKMKKLFCTAFIIVMLVLITPAYGSTAEELEGDQWITNTTEWTNRHISITGNLTISHNGTLTLDNTTIQMNCSSSQQYQIIVDANGILIINDSTITSIAKDVNKTSNIWLKKNASYSDEKPTIQAINSTFTWLGHTGSKRADTGAGAVSLYYSTSDCWLKNCTFDNCTGGMVYVWAWSSGGGAHIDITGCRFTNFLTSFDGAHHTAITYYYNGAYSDIQYLDECWFHDWTSLDAKALMALYTTRCDDVTIQNVNYTNVGGPTYNLDILSEESKMVFANINITDCIGTLYFNEKEHDMYLENIIGINTMAFHYRAEASNITVKKIYSSHSPVIRAYDSHYPENAIDMHFEDIYGEDVEAPEGFSFRGRNSTARNVTILGAETWDVGECLRGAQFSHRYREEEGKINSSDNIFEDFELLGRYYSSAIELYHFSNSTFRDFLINTTTAPKDIRFLGNNSNNKFINLKYNSTKIEFDNDNDEFTPYYYLDVFVEDQNGNPVDGATVTITNEVDASYTSIDRAGNSDTSFTTGADGHIQAPDEPNPVERYSDYFAMDASTDYSFGGWMKLNDNDVLTFVHGFLILYEYDTNKNMIAARVLPMWAEADWTEKRYNFTTKSDTVYGRVKLDTYSKGGSAWFDDIYVKKIESGTNILPDPGFESGSSTPDNWDAVDDYRGFWSNVSHSGSKSYMLVWNFDWPNDKDVACIGDYAQTNTGTTDFNYDITVEKDGKSATVTGINPDENWYRSDPGVPTKTIVLTLDTGPDTTPPTMTAHSPTGTSVPTDTIITATFSKAMNTSSTESALSISPSVSGSFSWDENKMIFTPDSDLDYETTYTVTISTEAKDLADNNLEYPFSWQFTTRAPGLDLVGEWHFNEGSGEIAEDTSGNNNDGILINIDPATDWVNGKLGNALAFDGVDGYVDCGHNANLDLKDKISILLWIKPNAAGEGGPNAGPVCKAESGVDWSWQLRYNAPGGGNYMGFQFNGDPEGSTWVSVKQNLSPGEWYHIAGTFDGTTLKCYLNGIDKDTNQISAIKSGNSTLFIGQDGWGNIFNGTIDEVRIYDKALTPEEIQADYEAGSKDTTASTTPYGITPTPDEAGWNNATPVVVTFFRSDNGAGSGIEYTNYSKISETGPWTTVNVNTALGSDAENVSDISEDKFNLTVSDEGVTNIWYYSVNDNSVSETVKNLTVKIDTTPPSTISDLQNTTGITWINWTWTNPSEEDFSHAVIYLDGVWQTNTSEAYYNVSGLSADTTYGISTRTVDTNGNVNTTTWVNQTATTLAVPNSAPDTPGNPYPSIHASDLSIVNTDLSWSGGDPDAGDTVTYDVYFGTATSPSLVSTDQTGTTYDPGTLDYDTTYYWQILATDNHGVSTTGPLWDFTTTGSAPNGAVSGTITSTNDGTGVSGVTVNLTLNSTGTVIASTTTGSSGDYTFTNLTPGEYTLTASKIRFWSDSTSVTVNAGEFVTVNSALWRKGDLNNNGISADAGDRAMMKDASVGKLTADWRYDLNTNGLFADVGDQAMMKDASVGEIELL